MKIIKLSLLIILSLTGIFSGYAVVVIKGEIKGKVPERIKYSNPIHGVCYNAFTENVRPDEKGNFRIEIDLDKPSFIWIALSDKITRHLLVEPRKSYQIILEENGSVLINGSCQKGQELYNSFPAPFMAQQEAKKFARDTSMTAVEEKIETLKNKDLDDIKKLLDNKEISPAFYDLVKTDRDCYYAAIKADLLLVRISAEKPSSRTIEGLNKVFNEVSFVNESLMSSPYWYEYAQYYLLNKKYAEKDFNLQRMKENRVTDKRITYELELAKKYLPIGSFEYYSASTIYFNGIQNDYEKELVDLYKDFVKEYPQSKFTIYLTPLIDKIENFHKIAAQEFRKEVVFVDNYEKFNSFQECISAFKGKKIFIDVWATWCGPCKAEFAYKEKLKELLKPKGIEILYISIDKDPNDQQWKNMIKFYDLEGNHVRANQQFLKDLIKLYDQKGTIFIPWYMLVNEKGEIVKSHAAYPSNTDKLKSELEAM